MAKEILDEYGEFIQAKAEASISVGFEPKDMGADLFDFQRAIVEWAHKSARATAQDHPQGFQHVTPGHCRLSGDDEKAGRQRGAHRAHARNLSCSEVAAVRITRLDGHKPV